MKKENISSTGTLVASALAAICCIGPAIALVTGASMGVLGSLMILDPYRPWLLAAGSSGEAILTLRHFYFGYSFSFVGGLIGLIWGFIDGFICGLLFAFLYNTFLKKQT